jgi:AraC-like DNA-binding protein
MSEFTGKTVQRPHGLVGIEVHRGHHVVDANASSYSAYFALTRVVGSASYTYRGSAEERVGEHVALINAGEFVACQVAAGLRHQYWFVAPEVMAEAADELGLSGAPHFSARFVDAACASVLHLSTTRISQATERLEQQEIAENLLAFVLGRYADRGKAEVSDPIAHRSVRRMRDLLHDAYDHPLALDELADCARLNKFSALRAFRRSVGVTPHEYQRRLRVGHAYKLLRSDRSIAEVAQTLGFYDQSHFTRTFREVALLTPHAYRAAMGGRGEFATVEA